MTAMAGTLPSIDRLLRADAGAVLRELVARQSEILPRDRSAWAERCKQWKAKYPVISDEHRQPGKVSVYHLAETIAAASQPGDQIISGSSGVGIEIFLFAYPARTGQRVVHTAGLGAMGYGIAASIGASLATGRSKAGTPWGRRPKISFSSNTGMAEPSA